MRATLVDLGAVTRRRHSFDTLWGHLKKGLESAGWTPNGSLSGIVMRAYRNLPVLAEADVDGLAWLWRHWAELPRYQQAAAQEVVTAAYQSGDGAIRSFLTERADYPAGSRFLPERERLPIPLSYYFQPVGARANLWGRCLIAAQADELPVAPPYVPIMLRHSPTSDINIVTLATAVEQEETFKRQTGGANLFARLKLRIEPTNLHRDILVENWIEESRLPGEFTPAILQTIFERCLSTENDGQMIGGIDIKLLDGRFHEVDSSQLSFKIVTKMVLNMCIENGGLRPLWRWRCYI